MTQQNKCPKCPRCGGHVYPPELDPEGFYWLVCQNGHSRMIGGTVRLPRGPVGLPWPASGASKELLARVRTISLERTARALERFNLEQEAA